jgi:hypothetical protein
MSTHRMSQIKEHGQGGSGAREHLARSPSDGRQAPQHPGIRCLAQPYRWHALVQALLNPL